jgi:signal peptidase I
VDTSATGSVLLDRPLDDAPLPPEGWSTLGASPAEPAALDLMPASAEPEPYPFRRVVIGCLGRIWLWFLVGCVAITILPLLIGWSSYLIETGSMRPSINPGDVVITSPNPTIEQLGGRVITFDSPSVPGRVVTHRVVEISDDGQMRTKGDANPTADTATITIDDVRGMGRLLVKYVGLPKIWLQNGEVLPLTGFLLSLVLAGLAVRYDREEEDIDGVESNPHDSWSSGPPQDPEPGAWTRGSAEGSGAPFLPVGVGQLRAALTQPDSSLSDVLPAPRRWRPTSALVFVLLTLFYAAALFIPSAMAAVSATTRTAASSWSVPQYSYTSTLQALNPWLYYKLDDTTGNNATDSSGNGRTGTYNGTYTRGVVGALTTDTPNLAVTSASASSCIFTPNSAKLTPAPTVYSSTAWFRVPNGYNQGGKILGFESARTGVSDSTNGGQYDRHVYMDGSGFIRYGVWLGQSFTLKSTSAYNDGNWHMVATTMGPSGMRLYIDGVLQASSTNTASETFSDGGWWRFGCGNLSGWTSTSGTNEAWSGPNAPTAQQNYRLVGGSLDEVAIWQNTVFTAADVAFLYFSR